MTNETKLYRVMQTGCLILLVFSLFALLGYGHIHKTRGLTLTNSSMWKTAGINPIPTSQDIPDIISLAVHSKKPLYIILMHQTSLDHKQQNGVNSDLRWWDVKARVSTSCLKSYFHTPCLYRAVRILQGRLLGKPLTRGVSESKGLRCSIGALWYWEAHETQKRKSLVKQWLHYWKLIVMATSQYSSRVYPATEIWHALLCKVWLFT